MLAATALPPLAALLSFVVAAEPSRQISGHASAAAPPITLTPALAAQLASAAPDQMVNVVIVLRAQPAAAIIRARMAPAAAAARDLSHRMQSIVRPHLPAGPMSPQQERAWWPTPPAADVRAALRDLALQRDERLRAARLQAAAAAAQAVKPEQDAFAGRIAQRGGVVTARGALFNMLTARVPAGAVAALGADPRVVRIEPELPGVPELDVQRVSLGLDAGFWAAGIDGGVHDVGVLDTGVQQNHPALAGHPFLTNAGTTDGNGHGTAVCGIMASADATFRGMCFGCDKIVVAIAGSMSTSMPGMDYIASTGEPENVNYSFGNGAATDADYTTTDQFFDAVIDAFGFMVSKSAGNNGYHATLPTITHPAPAYNLLACANMDDMNSPDRNDHRITSSSSVGPTLGGRKKPDITAPGSNTITCNAFWQSDDDFVNFGGTSSAAPHVGGAVVLLLDLGVPDVTAAKAVLINTADAMTDNDTASTLDDQYVPGSLWNRRYGWGYLNLASAYLHGLDVFSDEIPDAPESADHRLYRGQMFAFEKATLVWRRHVAYAGATFPTQLESLSNLDLFAYRESDGELLDQSASLIDNVEQLHVDEDGMVVLKVDAAAAFDPDVLLEPFALAAQENFAPALGPAFAAGLDHPASVPVGSAFVVTAQFTNTGDLPAHGVTVQLAGVTILDGANPAPVGALAPGADGSAEWLVLASHEPGDHTLTVSIVSNSYGEVFASQAQSSYLGVPVLLGDLNCDGVLDSADVPAFVLALLDPDAYESTYPACIIYNGDFNFDVKIDGQDINPFVDALF